LQTSKTQCTSRGYWTPASWTFLLSIYIFFFSAISHVACHPASILNCNTFPHKTILFVL
jgi:hypothetical protein